MKDVHNDVIMEYEGGIFTYTDMYELIKKEISKIYFSYAALRVDYTIDDLTNDVMLTYMSPMKSTGENRLQHYLDKYQGDINHLKNLFKLSARQQLNMALRNKHIKYKGFSLNTVVSHTDDNIIEYQDLLVDESIDFDTKLEEQDFINSLIKDLDEYNKRNMYMISLEKQQVKSRLEFILDPNNLINVAMLTEKHKQMIIDLLNGYKVYELKTKYKKDYKYLMDGIKAVLQERKVKKD